MILCCACQSMYNYWCALAALKPDCIAGRFPRLVAIATSNEGFGRWCSTGASTSTCMLGGQLRGGPQKRPVYLPNTIVAHWSLYLAVCCCWWMACDGHLPTAIRLFMYVSVYEWADQVQHYCIYDCVAVYVFVYFIWCHVGSNFVHMRTFVPGSRLTCMQACMYGNYLANFQ